MGEVFNPHKFVYWVRSLLFSLFMYLYEKQYKIAMILLCPVKGPWAYSLGLSTWCLCNVICSKCDIVLYILRHETFYLRYLYVNIIQVCIAKGSLGSVFVPACANFDILLCFDVFAQRQNKEIFPYNMFLLFRIWRHLSTTSQQLF